jgi:hypothetical protein
VTNLSTELARLAEAATPGAEATTKAVLYANLPAIIAALKAAETPMGGVAGLVERLRKIRNSDHVRGCEGRCMSCSCGYEADTEIALDEAAEAITALTRQLAERDAEVKRLREAFGQYGRHRMNCPAIREGWDQGPCECGFQATRQALGGDNG